MKLRNQLEVALTLARFTLHGSLQHIVNWSEPQLTQFCNHVAYLEHLWKKKLSQATGFDSQTSLLPIAEEILATRLLVRVAAAVQKRTHRPENSAPAEQPLPPAASAFRLTLCCDQLGELFEECRTKAAVYRDQESPRFKRLAARMMRWESLLTESSDEVDGESPLAPSGQSRPSFSSPVLETAWPLLQKGLLQSISAGRIDDPTRAGVHRVLQQLAISLIPRGVFFRNGQAKPRWLQSIAIDSRVSS